MSNHKLSEGKQLWAYAKLPLVLLIVFLVVSVFSFLFAKAGAVNWLMEVFPAILGIAVLLFTYKRFPMSHLVYWFVLIHAFVLIYGGHYTYAETPLGNWAKEVFHFSRNHYDRVGHLALGFFPVIIIREVLLRNTPLQRGGWLVFIELSIVLAIGAFWELLEWWSVLLTNPEVGTAFLGTQGDIWDAQWDMLLAVVGAIVSLCTMSRFHDRSMAKIPK